jgi:modulator of FtsH protease HflK
MSKKDFQNPWDDDPNDLEQAIKKSQKKIASLFGGGSGDFNFPVDLKKIVTTVILVVAAGWLSTGFYTIQPDQQGVVMRFGEYSRTSSPGLNYKLPSPIETVTKVSVTSINKEEIGYRSKGMQISSKTQLLQNTVANESQMLTTDENIVDINFDVQWRILDAKEYLFNVRDKEGENTVKNVAESAMREVIGLSEVTDVLAEERSSIEQRVKTLMQHMLDNYKMGVNIERVQLLRVDPPQYVIDAYRDVQNAKQDKAREINKAHSYRNDIVPRARGEAEKILQEADAYKQKVVAAAKGEAERFNTVYEQYRAAKDVTRKRMYIETMEEILANVDKIIVDKSASNVVPFLPLNEINKTKDKQ